MQTLPQNLNKNIQEIEIVQELCELVGITYSKSKESSFSDKIPAYFLNMMTRFADNLEIGETLLNPKYFGHRIARTVLIEVQNYLYKEIGQKKLI